MKGETFDYLCGYHAAMTLIAEEALAATKEAQAIHNATPPSLLGFPRAAHYIELGKGRAAKAIGEIAYEKAQEAFAARVGAR